MLVELAPDRYLLHSEVNGKPLVVEGALDVVVASVPDDDLEAVVDACVAAGKQLGRQ
jgi:hypothetical protein